MLISSHKKWNVGFLEDPFASGKFETVLFYKLCWLNLHNNATAIFECAQKIRGVFELLSVVFIFDLEGLVSDLFYIGEDKRLLQKSALELRFIFNRFVL